MSVPVSASATANVMMYSVFVSANVRRDFTRSNARSFYFYLAHGAKI